MLHDRRQRDWEGLRELADRYTVLLAEPGDERTSGRVGERREGAVKDRGLILNHQVK